MNSTVNYNIENPMSAFAAIFMLCNGVFGVICNVLIFKNFIENKEERNAFNLICFFRAFTNLHILITIFLAIFVPTTILGYSLYNPASETVIILLGLTVYYVNEYETIVIALNRFFALHFPIVYPKIFGMKRTFTIILILYTVQIIDLVYQITQLLPLKCYLYFDVTTLTWSPTLEPRCSNYSSSSIIFTFGACFIGDIIFNILNMIKLVKFYQNKMTGGSIESRARLRKNIRLFIQTCFQDSLFVLDVVFTFELASLSSSRVWTFISGTVIWQCLHSFDGFIMMMFNERIRFFKNASSAKVRSVSNTASSGFN